MAKRYRSFAFAKRAAAATTSELDDDDGGGEMDKRGGGFLSFAKRARFAFAKRFDPYGSRAFAFAKRRSFA